MSHQALLCDWINTLSSVEQKIFHIASLITANCGSKLIRFQSADERDALKTQADTVGSQDLRCKETIRPRVRKWVI
jgi:hypothetical protein